jgi:hypothetical protein
MTDERPITLAEAAAEYRLTVSTLRAEAARGRLDIFRLGKRDYTTPQAMRDMVRKCQDAARLRASTSTNQEASGSSETDRASSAQAALSQTVAALKAGLPRISGKNINRRAAPTH